MLIGMRISAWGGLAKEGKGRGTLSGMRKVMRDVEMTVNGEGVLSGQRRGCGMSGGMGMRMSDIRRFEDGDEGRLMDVGMRDDPLKWGR